VAAEVRLEFYRGIKEIANFLGLHPDTVAQKLREGKIPAKKDGLGRWVLSNLDYYRSLKDVRETEPEA
jgi:excisionase family DNA binding protein